MKAKINNRSLRITKLMAISATIWIIVVASLITYSQISMEMYSPNYNLGNNAKIIDITEKNASEIYTIIKNEGLYLVYFKQVDCPGCKILEPGLMSYVSKQRLNLTLVQVYIDFIFRNNMDEAFRIMDDFDVYGTPTLILYKDGRELGRQVGIFSGDQYEGVKNFVERSLRGEITATISSSLRPIIEFINRYIVFLAPVIGLVASISPCSIPMIAAFSTTVREKSVRIIKILAIMLVITVPVALGLAYISIYGAGIYGISIYYSILLYIGILLGLWGALTIANIDVISSIRSRFMLPILGLQCSSPFLFMIIALASKNIVLAITSTILFSLGYIAPYILSLKILSKLHGTVSSRKILRYIQGAILLSIAIYLLLESYSNILI